MSKRRKAPADRPSTLVAPGYHKEQKARAQADLDDFNSKAGPVTVKKMYPGIGPDGVYRLHAGLDGRDVRYQGRRLPHELSNDSLWLLQNGGNVLRDPKDVEK